MLRNLLICGLIAGLCAGLLATGFARLVGEAPIDRAIAFESAKAKAAGQHEEAPIVSRTLQKSLGLLTAAVVYGLSVGGLFGIAFAVVYGRVGRASPARTSILLAAFAFVVIYLVPFVKYPANPPSVGDPNTIGRRTALYLIMILISLLAAVAAVQLRAVLARRWSASTATLLAGAGYLLVVVVAGWALPSVQEVPRTFPAVTLFRFREASVGMQAVIWTTIGLVFAGTAQRVMTGQTIIPRRRPSGAAAPASD
ncbi:MAG: CbtA family protein [Actinomycetota bacterium]|nr:CbtA family protein [Actinomycetota bacterium]